MQMHDAENIYLVKISSNFQHPLFFDKTELTIRKSEDFMELLTFPFIYDLLYVNGKLYNSPPWEKPHEILPKLYKKWSELNPIIKEYFANRDRSGALEPMKISIALFLDTLYWGNNQPVTNIKNWENQLKSLVIKPVNVEERLSYIIHTPNHYLSFVQLLQLFDELQKKFLVTLTR
jgi:hypothetical protein